MLDRLTAVETCTVQAISLSHLPRTIADDYDQPMDYEPMDHSRPVIADGA